MTQSETRICQNCKASFEIDASDFAFYQKIQVPPPSWCPECRLVRRMTWRNERSLYKTKGNKGMEIITIFPPNSPFNVYDRDVWWSDRWNPLDFGLDVDFSKNFFVQFRELLERVPLPALFANSIKDSSYVNHVGHMNRCYLTHASWQCEDVIYGEKIVDSKNVVDAYLTNNSEFCYETVDCAKCSKLLYSQDCYQCADSAFLYDCKNCQNCFGCVGLRNKSYYIFNQPRSKEEYAEFIQKHNLGSQKTIEEFRSKLEELKKIYPRKFACLINTVNVQGDHCRDMKNCNVCFDLMGPVEDSKYMTHGGLGITDSYDGYGVGAGCNLLYEGIDSGDRGSLEKFSVVVYACQNSDYCFNCENSSNLFGCIGVRKKQYCILNKQYTKEEYEVLVPKIIEHMNQMPYMDKKGRIYKYGEFFPPELSPFAYNETIAQEYFPLTKEQAIEQGYRWKEPEERNYEINVRTEELKDNIKDVKDNIIGKVIECAHQGKCNEQCTTAFKIIPDELAFYRKMNLPLPRLCPNCRHYARLRQRNPLKLWHRRCMCAGKTSEVKGQMPAPHRREASGAGSDVRYENTVSHFHGEGKCPNEFETSYSPERPEIVYCEQCYNAEVV